MKQLQYDDEHWADLIETIAARVSLDDFVHFSTQSYAMLWKTPLEHAAREVAKRFAVYGVALQGVRLTNEREREDEA